VREVSTIDPGAALPAWPALPGRPEPDLDRIARRLRGALDVRAVLVSLVSAAGQVVPGVGGLWDAGRCLPLGRSLCPQVVLTGHPLVVDDIGSWAAPAGVVGPVVPWLCAYAGVPLTDEAGRVVGAVSALADRPRRWLPRDVDVLVEAAGRCRDLVRLRAAQVALEQCVAEAARARRQALTAADNSWSDLVRATADLGRHRMVSAVADALAEVAGTATDVAEVSAVVEAVLGSHVGVAAVRLAAESPSPARSLSSTGAPSALAGPAVDPSSVRLWVVPQVAEPSALVLQWPGCHELQAEDRDALGRVAALVAQALDRLHLVRQWEGAARAVVERM
jgi:hypothetical protein